MRAREFTLEVKLGPNGSIDTQKYASSTLDQRGPGAALPRDAQGHPIEPGLEQPLVSPDDLLMPLAGAGRKVIQGARGLARNSLGKRAYDLANKPSIYNPLTLKNIGNKQSTARYHADQAFRKEFGQNPPSFADGDEVIQKFGGRDAYRQASERYAEIFNDFAQRGYQYDANKIPTIQDKLPRLDPNKVSRPGKNRYDFERDLVRALDKAGEKSLSSIGPEVYDRWLKNSNNQKDNTKSN